MTPLTVKVGNFDLEPADNFTLPILRAFRVFRGVVRVWNREMRETREGRCS